MKAYNVSPPGLSAAVVNRIYDESGGLPHSGGRIPVLHNEDGVSEGSKVGAATSPTFECVGKGVANLLELLARMGAIGAQSGGQVLSTEISAN